MIRRCREGCAYGQKFLKWKNNKGAGNRKE